MAQYQGKAQPVGDPADWIEPVFFDGWWVQSEPNTTPAPQANSAPAVAFVGEPDDLVEVAFDTFGWEQATQEPVEHGQQYSSDGWRRVVKQGQWSSLDGWRGPAEHGRHHLCDGRRRQA